MMQPKTKSPKLKILFIKHHSFSIIEVLLQRSFLSIYLKWMKIIMNLQWILLPKLLFFKLIKKKSSNLNNLNSKKKILLRPIKYKLPRCTILKKWKGLIVGNKKV